MSTNYVPTRRDFGTGDRRWARNFLALDTNGVTLDGSAWTAGVTVPSGTHVALDDDGYGVPYEGTANAGAPSVGLLVNDWTAAPGDHLVSVASGGGPVDRRYLPAGHDADAEASLTAINFIN